LLVVNWQQKTNDSVFSPQEHHQGRLAMLAYSLGEDGLWWCKNLLSGYWRMFEITDTSKELYHAQLSKSHTAYD